MDDLEARLVRDTLVAPAIGAPQHAAHDALARVLRGRINRGARVAITAGSRGIANIPAILRGLVAAVRDVGGEPFLVAAMGSHGGGTGPGQREMLAYLGVTEESIGAPIASEMDVLEVGTTESGVRVYCDAIAAKADAVVVAGRVKPHTDFSGAIESGILKMTSIGLGKAIGAKEYHAAFARMGYERIIREVAAVQFANVPIVAGVGYVEDHRGNTHAVEAFPVDQIVANEERMLVTARELLSVLPFDELDLLVVDEMGKNISGAGMDTNVTARAVDGRTQKTPAPLVRQLFVRDLTEQSHGNATGVGLADFCLRRLADKIDWHATYLNSLTAAQPASARLPVVCTNDREAIRYALTAAGVERMADARVARIKNTLHIETMVVTNAALEAMRRGDRYAVGGASDGLTFGANDEFVPFPVAV
ncbi:MAG: lactate racemase domain-containing protein [Candidatus Velthaea sp.]